MVEVWVNQSFSFHFLFEEEVVGGAEVSLHEILLSGSMSKEQVGVGSLLYVNYTEIKNNCMNYLDGHYILILLFLPIKIC